MSDDFFRQRRNLGGGLLAAAAGLALPLRANANAEFPSKPVRMIVPFPAGGGVDLPARQLAQQVSVHLGQPVIVDNRPGADGSIAAGVVARSAPDGYTILFATSTALSYALATRKNPRYSLDDFAAISNFAQFGLFLTVHESVPGKTVRDVIEYVRSRPGQVAYGAANSGSTVLMADIQERSKLDMVAVQYKGEALGVVDLVAGRIQMMMLTPALLSQVMKDGKCRPIGVLLKERSALMPDVPTLVEQGLPLPEIALWGGFVAPAATPADIVGKLSRSMTAAMQDAQTAAKLRAYGLQVQGSTPEAFDRFLRDQAGSWRRAVELAKIPMEA